MVVALVYVRAGWGGGGAFARDCACHGFVCGREGLIWLGMYGGVSVCFVYVRVVVRIILATPNPNINLDRLGKALGYILINKKSMHIYALPRYDSCGIQTLVLNFRQAVDATAREPPRYSPVMTPITEKNLHNYLHRVLYILYVDNPGFIYASTQAIPVHNTSKYHIYLAYSIVSRPCTSCIVHIPVLIFLFIDIRSTWYTQAISYLFIDITSTWKSFRHRLPSYVGVLII